MTDFIEVIYKTETKKDKFNKLKLLFTGLTLKNFEKLPKKWILFADITDNNLSFHNEFLVELNKIVQTEELIYFFDDKYLINDSKCYLVQSKIDRKTIYDIPANTTYTYLTTWGPQGGSFNFYQLINYRFEDELWNLYNIFINHYEMFFSKTCLFRYKYVFDFEKHIFKYYKPFVFILNLNYKNYNQIRKLTHQLAQLNYPYFRILILSSCSYYDYPDFKFKKVLVIQSKTNSRIKFIHMCSSSEYVIILNKLESPIINLYELNKIHNSFKKTYFEDFFSCHIPYYIENVPLMLGFDKYLEPCLDSTEDVNYLLSLDDKCFLKNNITPKMTRHVHKIEEPFFTKLKRYLVRRDIQEGLCIVYKELETTKEINRFNALIMTLISFLAIAEDTQNIEKELFRATVVFKNDHATYKQYFIIVENTSKYITPKFKKLFYNKALEFKEYDHVFKSFILTKLLDLPDIETHEMRTYISIYGEINKFLSSEQNKMLITLFLKRLSLLFLEENLIQDFTNILFENFKADNKIHSKYQYDLMLSKFKDIFPELIVRLALHFNQYENNIKEIIQRRIDISKSLDCLQENWIITYPLDNIAYTFDPVNFPLSYHGLSSKDIFIKKSLFFRKICPELNYTCDLSFKNKLPRIGFISGFIGRIHSVYKDRHMIINKLSNFYQVYVINDTDFNEDVKFNFNKATFIKISTKLSEAKKIIEDLKLDILVYCEIGMHPVYYFLAHMRLAKIQCNTWGHSDTSGINTIDYFITSSYYEDPISYKNNYSEKPILLDSLCTYYVNPLKFHHENKFKNRIELGYSENVNIYLCSQSLFKIHPSFDEYIRGILENDSNGIFILLDTFGNKKRIINRFQNTFPTSILGKIHFVNGMQHFDYLNLIKICDVMIDTYPFGGCNSSLEAFSLGRPVITQPSKLLNGRFTYGFYKKMGFLDIVASSKEQYIAKAVKLGSNREYNNHCSSIISRNKHKLFEEEKSFLDWKKMIASFLK